MKSFNCPHCDGISVLHIEQKSRTFRKEEFQIFEYYYKCTSCKEEFTTTGIDEINVNQVYNQYREKYCIPFPKQLEEISERYNLSAAKMSDILGLGANQYRLYEAGEIPSLSAGTLLNLIMNPKEFRKIVLSKQELIKNSDKILGHLEKLIDQENTSILDYKQIFFNLSKTPNRFNGFTIPDFDKFANIVLSFIDNAPFKVRLNKLLFYADSAHYKYYGASISGCRYAAIPMGPVPNNYSYIFSLLESEGYLANELVSIKEKENEKFIALKTFNPELFNNSELNILKDVLKKFQSLSTKEIMNISHKEKAWLDNNKHKSIIDFAIYAPQLIAL